MNIDDLREEFVLAESREALDDYFSFLDSARDALEHNRLPSAVGFFKDAAEALDRYSLVLCFGMRVEGHSYRQIAQARDMSTQGIHKRMNAYLRACRSACSASGEAGGAGG